MAELMDLYRAGDVVKGKRVAWVPQPRQAEFMRRFEDEVLFGGAAGGGKSDALVPRLCGRSTSRTTRA